MPTTLRLGVMTAWLLAAGGLAAAAPGGKGSMEEATRLANEGDQLLGSGQPDEGMKRIRRALDLAPALRAALDNFAVTAVMYPARYGDELFTRLERAVAAAPAADKVELRWLELRYAVFFDRAALAHKLAAASDALVAGDELHRAELGATLADLGDRAAGERLLHAAHGPYAAYHLARLAEGQGNAAEARRRLQTIPAGDPQHLLRDFGLVSLQLHAGERVDKAPLVAQIRAQEDMPVHVISESLVVRLRLALAEKDQAEVTKRAKSFGLAVAVQSPSAMLRARALVGPLYTFGQVKEKP